MSSANSSASASTTGLNFRLARIGLMEGLVELEREGTVPEDEVWVEVCAMITILFWMTECCMEL
jgi:hypothetical protein